MSHASELPEPVTGGTDAPEHVTYRAHPSDIPSMDPALVRHLRGFAFGAVDAISAFAALYRNCDEILAEWGREHLAPDAELTIAGYADAVGADPHPLLCDLAARCLLREEHSRFTITGGEPTEDLAQHHLVLDAELARIALVLEESAELFDREHARLADAFKEVRSMILELHRDEERELFPLLAAADRVDPDHLVDRWTHYEHRADGDRLRMMRLFSIQLAIGHDGSRAIDRVINDGLIRVADLLYLHRHLENRVICSLSQHHRSRR